MQEEPMYFEHPGKENTIETLNWVKERATELGVHEIVLPSTSGATAFQALEVLAGFNLTVVTYHCGFKEPFKAVMPAEARAELESQGAKVVSATHALSGVERSLAKKFSGSYPVLLIAQTLKLFGQGTKVAVEVAIMAADAGALTGKDIIALGGSSKGVDTALVLKPTNQSNLFDMRIREIICKPRNF
jgi:hypothetical protein